MGVGGAGESEGKWRQPYLNNNKRKKERKEERKEGRKERRKERKCGIHILKYNSAKKKQKTLQHMTLGKNLENAMLS